jgi:pyruvate formate lyase activating enzyme
MLQIDFLTALFVEAKKRHIHTCLDTSGILFPTDETGKPSVSMKQVDELLAVTDLVLLDIKHIDSESHRRLTGYSNQASLAMASYLSQMGKPVWVRHVVVPDITFQKEELAALGEFLATLSNVEKIEALPYHAMGKVKYDALGISFPLKDTRQLQKEEAVLAGAYIQEGMNGEVS